MAKAIAKLITATIIVVFVFSALSFFVPAVHAANNVTVNPGFESSDTWIAHYSSFMGSYAKVQDSTYKHTGTYSGLTQTTAPKQEFCSASLYQSLDIYANSTGLFYYWIRKGNSAPNGYYYGEVCIYISGGYTLSYYHGFDGSSPPPDGSNYKYINVGDTPSGSWVQISRNLTSDLVGKFGSSILTQHIAGITLYSEGYKDLETYYAYGQRINWDDLWMDGIKAVYYNVTLTSSTTQGRINIGNITFAGTVYALPSNVTKEPGGYSATGNPPNGYVFDHWETLGGILVSNISQQTVWVTVSGNGTLRVVFRAGLSWTFMVYMCGDNDLDWWGRENINNMELAGSTDNVKILAMLDRDDSDGCGWLPGHPPPQRYLEHRYLIIHDTNPDVIASPSMWNRTEVNMGDPNTLVDFVNWSIQLYPAQRYALVLWDHGGGFEGICWDDMPYSNGPMTSDCLNMSELKWALNKIKTDNGLTINVLGFDACLMGQIEVAYQVRGLAKIYVGSEEVESVEGWPYNWILANLTNNPSMTENQLGAQIVTSYGHYYSMPGVPYGDVSTMSATDLQKIDGVAKSVSDLGSWLSANLGTVRSDVDWVRQNVYEYYNNSTDFVDAYDMAQLFSQRINDSTLQGLCTYVIQNITGAVFSEWHGVNATHSHGLQIYFQNVALQYNELEYDPIDMSVNYVWDNFLKAYLGI
jgi:hypothetical protein